MSIQLEWDVESNTGHRAVSEDQAIIAAHKRRARRIRTAILAVVVGLAVISGLAMWRSRIVEAERLDALYATIDAEALALRLGDQHKYMQIQGPAERWRAAQRQQFEDIQSLGVDVNVTGEVLNLLYRDDEAEVTIEIIVDDTPMQGIWLYEYTDLGWRHVATRQNPWVKQTVINAPFTFVYNSVQQPDVDALNSLLRKWWVDANIATGVSYETNLSFVIDPDAEIVAWTDDERPKLVIPAQVLADATLDEPRDPLRTQLAMMMAAHWADYILPEYAVNDVLEVWQHWQIELAMQPVFGLPTDPYYALDELTDAFDAELFPQFVGEAHEWGEGLIALRNAVIHNAPPTPDEAYFESLLEFLAVANAYEPGLRYDARRAIWLFVDADDVEWVNNFVMSDWLLGTQPGTIRVEDMDRRGDVIWVTTTFDYNPYWYDANLQDEIYPMTRQIPFRKVDGYWQVTSPNEADWGETIIVAGEYVTLNYSEIDADYFEEMLPEIEEIYLQATVAYGIDPPPRIEVDVLRIMDYRFDSDPTVIAPIMASPRITALPTDAQIDEMLHRQLINTMYYEVFEYAAGEFTEPANASQMENTLRAWGAQRYDVVTSPNTDWMSTVEVQPNVHMLDDWDDLWWTISYSGDKSNSYYWTLMTIGSDTFLKLIMEQCGEDIFFPLVQNIRQHPTPQAWIEASVNANNCDAPDMTVMENLWRDLFFEEVRRIFGAEAFQ